MVRRTQIAILFAALCMVATVSRSAEPTNAALVATLRKGGHVIYFRHAQTDWSQSDQVRRAGDWLSCDGDAMRQLSGGGRDVARRVGNAMRSLDIPVSKVLASPYCRTVQTAALMKLGPVETTTDVMNLRVADYFGGRSAIVATARARLATAPAPGSSTVIVAHGNVAREATPVYPAEAEGVVFRPDGNGGFRLVTRVTPEAWEALAAEFSRR